ncbi:MAG: hypothetical protein ACJA2O_003298 [Candidatus Azotimanducaceae bacterium]|jgi:hypothetical protein
MTCQTKTLAKSSATSVTYCQGCNCYHLTIGPVTCRLDEVMYQQVLATLGQLTPPTSSAQTESSFRH